MVLVPMVVVVAPLFQMATIWFLIVLPVIEVPEMVAALAPRNCSSMRAMASVDGAPLASPQLLPSKVLFVIEVVSIVSLGALAWSVIPDRKLWVTLLLLMMVPVMLVLAALSATTIWPMSGPFGPK